MTPAQLEQIAAMVAAKLKVDGFASSSDVYSSIRLPPDVGTRGTFRELVKKMPGAVKHGNTWMISKSQWDACRGGKAASKQTPKTADCLAEEACAAETSRVAEGTSKFINSDELVSLRTYAEQSGIALGTLGRYAAEGMPTVSVGVGASMVCPSIAKLWIDEHYKDSIAQNREAQVYFVRRASDGAVKIGMSSDPIRRLDELRRDSGEHVYLLTSIVGDKPLELRLHAQFSADRLDGEWFSGAKVEKFLDTLSAAASALLDD